MRLLVLWGLWLRVWAVDVLSWEACDGDQHKPADLSGLMSLAGPFLCFHGRVAAPVLVDWPQ